MNSRISPGDPELPGLRFSYGDRALSEADADPDPVRQFTLWFAEAKERTDLPEPNAMVLSTADAGGRPSSRTVLLKGYDAAGFVFYTNYGSRKARELTANPRASLLFPWRELHRQVIIEGAAVRLSPDENADYFRVRPHGSQIGAWASHQSSVLESRAELEDRYAELSARWTDDVPVPGFWGGFRVVPETVEFWQGRRNRLHDRLRYRLAGGSWIIERLAP